MKAARLAILALACTLPLAAAAQWQWVDKDGRKVFSDKMPPPDIPPERILKGPKGQMQVLAPAPAGTAAAALPGPAGKDQALEQKKKQLAAEQDGKKKEQETKLAALRAENCNRARSAKATYSAGGRLMRADEKGQVQYLSEEERTSEIKRMDEVIARDCAQ